MSQGIVTRAQRGVAAFQHQRSQIVIQPARRENHGKAEGYPKGIAVVSRGISIRVPRTSRGGGGRGPTPGWPGNGGGGGGRGGDDHMPSYGERLRRYRLGLMLALSSVTMLFVSFTTAYVVRKAGAVWDPTSNDYVSNWVPLTLPVRLLVVDTFILLLSSFVLEFARRRAAEDVALAPIVGMPGIRVSASHALPWIWTTVALGVGFLGGQGYAWHQLRLTNTTFATSTSSSFFYMLTGVHAVHLVGGILALVYAGMTTWLHRPPETRRIVIDVTAWYWHFMGLLWIYIFALLYFAR
jgi:cytochrome c oxidase subunit 3